MLAVIGGTGLNSLEGIEGFVQENAEAVTTRFASSPLDVERFNYSGESFLFLPRHGVGHVIPPHKVNYRANIDALRIAGATRIVAMNAVGGIADELHPGALAIPDQLIDYSSGREGTFFDADELVHIDFSDPYSESMRQQLLAAAKRANHVSESPCNVIDGGVYACTQGPRLETKAEIRRLQNDGCTMVGMTGMPEAALAREAELSYACIALSVNWAAGISDEIITLDDIYAVVEGVRPYLHELLRQILTQQ